MKVSLTKGYEAEIDFSDWWKVLPYNWRAEESPNSTYAVRFEKGRRIAMHQVIADAPRVDHIDHDTLNNRKDNLRPATQSQNGANNLRPTGDSGYIGVWRHGSGWRGMVTKDFKRHSAGTYDTAEEAARARDILAKKLHGPFAQLNFEEC